MQLMVKVSLPLYCGAAIVNLAGRIRQQEIDHC
jgi:hypothetical protein